MWTKEELLRQVEADLSGHKLIVVSNREPYVHRRKNGKIEVRQPASGMAAAIDSASESLRRHLGGARSR